MITTMPRGFMGGIFLASFGCISIFYPNNKWGFLLSSFIAVVAYSVNSNAVLLSIPCLLYLFLENKKNTAFYIFAFIGIVSGLTFHLGTQQFYTVNPFYNLHKLDLNYSPDLVLEGFKNLDAYFNFNTPVFWNAGSFILPIFVLAGCMLLYKKKYHQAIVVLIVPVLIVFTFGFDKVHQGGESLFFHYSRMYLAMPVIIACCLSLFEFKKGATLSVLWMLVTTCYYYFNSHNLVSVIEKRVVPTSKEAVIITNVEQILKDCNRLNKVCSENRVDLFIISDHFYYDPYDYGCAACTGSFPKTLRPVYERRTWRLLEDENKIYKRIMIIDMNRNLSTEFTGIKKIPPDLYLLENNTVPTISLLDSLKIPYREFK